MMVAVVKAQFSIDGSPFLPIGIFFLFPVSLFSLPGV